MDHSPPHRHERRADGQRHPPTRPGMSCQPSKRPSSFGSTRKPMRASQTRYAPCLAQGRCSIICRRPTYLGPSPRAGCLRALARRWIRSASELGRRLSPGSRCPCQTRSRPVPCGGQTSGGRDCVVVGDSVWDLLAARRARALGVGLLSGGYGQDELERAGAYRVYQDPANLLRHLDEVGARAAE
jgi:hypothetical protein